MTEYRGYEITYRKNFRIADVRKSGQAFTAKTITRDASNDHAWLDAEAKDFIDKELLSLQGI